MERARTRSVAVLGGGIAAVAAAVAFRRALPETDVRLFAAGAEAEYLGAATPYVHEFHRLIGLQPELFRRRTGAIVARETEIRRAGKPAFRLVPLAEMPHVHGAALHQLWLRRTAADPAAGPPWEAVARRARRADDLAAGIGERFDARAYLTLLSELAAHLGVKLAGEAASPAELAETHDLVIDTRASDQASWLSVPGVPGEVRWQVRDRSEADGEAVETVDTGAAQVDWDNGAWRADAIVDGEARLAGQARTPWTGNVLAIGRAALQCETFDGQPLAVALAEIARALELLPRPGGSGREAAEYNRRTSAIHGFLLDWAVARWGAPIGPPPGLAALREQFDQRGRIPFRDQDPVPAGQWLGWLLGGGERPRHVDLTAMALSEERLAALFADR